MDSRCLASLQEVDARQWNDLAPPDAPFMRHEFLSALEQSGCVSPEKGWLPQHIVFTQNNRLAAAMPFYIKGHSWGEYVFDWAWADAYHRHGFEYYPKGLCAIPFTPAPSAKMLVDAQLDAKALRGQLVNRALEIADELKLSSIHSLFLCQTEFTCWREAGFIGRTGNQFHWQNRQYQNFDHYLDRFTADKRKKIRQQRKSVFNTGVRIEITEGCDVSDHHWRDFYRFYQNTIHHHGAISYLNLDFFTRLGKTMTNHVLLIRALKRGTDIAAALFIKSDTTLYGRYWGCDRQISNLHFELCYYQAIEYCIANGYACFEAGAQGEHKLARGLLPVATHSAHWLAQPQFFKAIADHASRESAHNQEYMDVLSLHSPFKQQ